MLFKSADGDASGKKQELDFDVGRDGQVPGDENMAY